MSMQGTVYRADNAYSHWGVSTTASNTAACKAVSGPTDQTNTDGRRVENAGTAPIPAVANAPKAGPVSTAAELQYNGHGHDSYGYDTNTRSVYLGPATIIMGVINGMAGQHKEKWDEGVFEVRRWHACVHSARTRTTLDVRILRARPKYALICCHCSTFHTTMEPSRPPLFRLTPPTLGSATRPTSSPSTGAQSTRRFPPSWQALCIFLAALPLTDSRAVMLTATRLVAAVYRSSLLLRCAPRSMFYTPRDSYAEVAATMMGS